MVVCILDVSHGSAVKNLSAIQETWVRSLGWENLLEDNTATHSSILAQWIPWTEEPGDYSSWGLKELDTSEATEHTDIYIECAY